MHTIYIVVVWQLYGRLAAIHDDKNVVQPVYYSAVTYIHVKTDEKVYYSLIINY